MNQRRSSSLYLILVVLFLISFTLLSGQFSPPVSAEVVAQEGEVPDATKPPPTKAPTQPPELPPAEIPEPITVILFGTGLAALSAAAAARKNKAE